MPYPRHLCFTLLSPTLTYPALAYYTLIFPSLLYPFLLFPTHWTPRLPTLTFAILHCHACPALTLFYSVLSHPLLPYLSLLGIPAPPVINLHCPGSMPSTRSTAGLPVLAKSVLINACVLSSVRDCHHKQSKGTDLSVNNYSLGWFNSLGILKPRHLRFRGTQTKTKESNICPGEDRDVFRWGGDDRRT